MQRGVYFDGWFPGQHCYHPSLPPRRLRMIDDLESMRATMLVWSALGGGSISLPYLENEAFGEIPERFRTYGFVNESEFIQACQARGIDVYGIVFEVQGWEFPAEIVDGKVVAFNELRGAGPRSWLGLREFTRDEGPAGWKPFRHYFPDGLVNSRGEQVTDLFEECASRDLLGNPLHAHWVECPDREHQNHFMDRNNPVWREYLKAIIRIQIDAGVAGVQLDESGSPIDTLRYGGCFCNDCVAGFRAYLQSVAPTAGDPELDALDLATFDYAEWLRAAGHTAGEAPQALPLYRYYTDFQRTRIIETFGEIVDYIREYGASKGRSVKVAGNLFNCFPYYYPMAALTDVLVTEMRITGDRQPWWFRHAAAFGQGKPVVVVENPYGGVIPRLVEELEAGRGFDRFRLSIFEAAAMGVNMTLPYGSWLGSEIENSYWAPRWLAAECGQFLEEIDGLTSLASANEVAVVYPLVSQLRAALDGDAYDDEGKFFTFSGETNAPVDSYWEVVETLTDRAIPFDAAIVPEEGTVANTVTAANLARYRTVVVPDCRDLTPAQHRELVGYLDGGGHILLHGAYGTALEPTERRAVTDHAGTTVVTSLQGLADAVDPQVTANLRPSAAVNVHALADGELAFHLVNYDYDTASDAVRPYRDLAVEVRTDRAVRQATLHRPGSEPVPLEVTAGGGKVRFVLPEVATYAVIHLV